MLLLLALLGGFGMLLADARPVAAHAAIEESDPAENAVLPTAPTLVTLRFTERLERSYSRAELYDQTGIKVSTAPSRAGDDAYAMVLDLPAGLANGTYSVAYRTLSADDGHTYQNYFAFTVGSAADVQAVVAPTDESVTAGPPQWLRSTSRWAALLGLAATIAVWPVWVLVLRPAIAPAWQAGPELTRRVRRLATVALGLAIGGSVFALLVQADAVAGPDGLLDGVRTTLNDTRYGQLWLIRVGLFLIYGAALTACAWWWPWRRPLATFAALALAAALPLPFSLIAHAAAQNEGRETAVASDVLHLLAASLWVGGVFVLLFGLVPTLPGLTPAGRRAVLARALPRFSALALGAWGVMGFTGLYAAWLQVGNLDALRETDYGRSLALKVGLLVPLLLLGAFNLLLVTRRLRREPGNARATNRWSRRFAAAVAVETVLVVLVLFVVGRLTSQPPAREAIAEQADRVAISLSADNQTGTLFLTPGAVGPNRYRLELGGGHEAHTADPTGTEALLRVRLPDQELGQQQIELAPVAGGAYEAQGSELSIAGDWQMEVVVRRPGTLDWVVTETRPVAAAPPQVDLPGEPWRFAPSGIAGLLLLVAGVGGLALAYQAGRTTLRRESAGLGFAALALGALLLFQARDDASSAAPTAGVVDAAAVTRGGSLFAANCVACHGPGGRGNGPAAAALAVPPADLTAPGSSEHEDTYFADRIENGIVASGMPAFDEALSDGDVRDVIAYVRSLQGDAAVAWNASSPAKCTVAPRSLDSLLAMADPVAGSPTPFAATPFAATPGPVTPAATPVVIMGTPGTPEVPPGQPADEATIAAVATTARDLAACTNARDVLRRLALYTDDHLRPTFARTPPGFEARATIPTTFALPAEWVAVMAVENVTVLADGRVAARVVATIPGAQSHSHAAPGALTPVPTPTAARASRDIVNVFAFARVGDRWLVDEVVA